MISVICVYNKEQLLKGNLLKGLESQTSKHESILIDNTQGKFKSAAEALNYERERANGKYIMFVHQDVELDSDLWLANTERILDSILDLGIAGVAGMSEKGKTNEERGRGYISDCGEIWKWSNAIQKPEEVQTLDECLLIIPKSVFNKLQFDEKTFDGWHCYGVDYCLSAKQRGLKSYVIPAFIYHRSLRLNVSNLLRYQKRLYNKHKKNYKKVYTTCGDICWLKLKLLSSLQILSPLYQRLFPRWIEHLKRGLADCDTVLDLGCGYNSPIQYCDVPFSVGVELHDPYLEESKKKGLHNEYIKADIRKMELKPKSFDAVIAIDLLEHLTKQEGYTLIKKMETWARKKVIITRPNGYLWQNGYDDNPLQEHKSGWSVKELRDLGFKVYGMNGWEKLKGYRASVKYKPAFLSARVSDLSQKVTYYYPKLAFQLFAIKRMGGEDDKLSQSLHHNPQLERA